MSKLEEQVRQEMIGLRRIATDPSVDPTTRSESVNQYNLLCALLQRAGEDAVMLQIIKPLPVSHQWGLA